MLRIQLCGQNIDGSIGTSDQRGLEDELVQ
jgi:hypothetical protein